MSLVEILLVVLLLMLLVGAWPVWPHMASYGYWPSGIIFVILIVALLAILMRGRR